MGWYGNCGTKDNDIYAKVRESQEKQKMINKYLSDALDNIEEKIGSGNPDIKQLAIAISYIISEEYGIHNFEEFMKCFENEYVNICNYMNI